MSDQKVKAEADGDSAVIEVESEDAIGVAKEVIAAMSQTIGDVSRVYVELGDPDTEAEPELKPNIFDGKEIGEETATHLVAHVLKRNGPMTVGDLTDEIDEYPSSTVSSALTNGKRGHLFKHEEDDGGPGLWSLTDWGHEEMNRVDWYPAEDGDE